MFWNPSLVESAPPGAGPKLNAGPSNIHAPGWQRLRRGELLLSSKCAAGGCWHCRCADRVHRHTRDVCLYCDSRDAYRPQKYPAPRELRKRSSPHEGRPGVHRVLQCLPGVARNLGRQALVVSAVVAGGDSSPLCRGRRARERLLQSLNTTFLRGG